MKLIRICSTVFFFILIAPGFLGAESNINPKNSVTKKLSTNLEQWQSKIAKGKPVFEKDYQETKDGAASLRIKGPGSGCWSTKVPVEAGKMYKISFFMKSRSKLNINNSNLNPDANFHASVMKNTKEGVRAVQWIDDFMLGTHSEWTKIYLENYLAEPGDKDLTISLCLNWRKDVSATDDSEIWFNGITIEEVSVPPPKEKRFNLSNKNGIDVFTAFAADRILKGDPTPRKSADRVAIQGARGEKVAFQIGVKPKIDLSSVSWEINDFTGPATISKKFIQKYRVEAINFTEKSDGSSTRQNREAIPDPLPPEDTSALALNENNAFYFVIDLPRNTRAGTYNNVLKLKQDNHIIAAIPVELKVWNFAVPSEPTFYMNADFWEDLIPYYDPGEKLAILKKYLKNIRDHRGITAAGKYTGVTDAEFPKIMSIFHELGWTRNPCIQWQNIPNFYGRYIKVMFNDKENDDFSPQFVREFTARIHQIQDVLKKEGCSPSFTIKIGDEPKIRDHAIVNFYKNFAKILQSIDPNIVTYSAGVPHPDFAPYFDRWNVNNLRAPFFQKEMKLMKQKGMYVNNITSPLVSPLRLRLLMWALWQDNYSGIEWWQINGWGYFRREKDSTGKFVRNFTKIDPWEGSGKGVYFIYPPRQSKKESGPINSLRWEAITAGLEDCEYFNLLKNLLKKPGLPGHLRKEGEQALQRLSEVVDHVPCVGIIENDHFDSSDISKVEEIRSQIGETINKINSLH
jgi:hypothetical protein